MKTGRQSHFSYPQQLFWYLGGSPFLTQYWDQSWQSFSSFQKLWLMKVISFSLTVSTVSMLSAFRYSFTLQRQIVITFIKLSIIMLLFIFFNSLTYCTNIGNVIQTFSSSSLSSSLAIEIDSFSTKLQYSLGNWDQGSCRYWRVGCFLNQINSNCYCFWSPSLFVVVVFPPDRTLWIDAIVLGLDVGVEGRVGKVAAFACSADVLSALLIASCLS